MFCHKMIAKFYQMLHLTWKLFIKFVDHHKNFVSCIVKTVLCLSCILSYLVFILSYRACIIYVRFPCQGYRFWYFTCDLGLIDLIPKTAQFNHTCVMRISKLDHNRVNNVGFSPGKFGFDIFVILITTFKDIIQNKP